MKYLLAVLALSTVGFAANAHVTSRTVKYVATLSPVKAVKDAGKGSYFLLKESTFPVRHPKKTSSAVARSTYKAGKQVF